MENWIWFKLFALKVDPHLTTLLYTEVQKTVAIDYGTFFIFRFVFCIFNGFELAPYFFDRNCIDR